MKLKHFMTIECLYHHNGTSILWEGGTITRKGQRNKVTVFQDIYQQAVLKTNLTGVWVTFLGDSCVFSVFLNDKMREDLCAVQGRELPWCRLLAPVIFSLCQEGKESWLKVLDSEWGWGVSCIHTYYVPNNTIPGEGFKWFCLTSNKGLCSPERQNILHVFDYPLFFKHAHLESGSVILCVFSSWFHGYVYCELN